MWDDVIIGEGASACTTISCYDCEGTGVSVSDNSLFFRVSGLIFGMGMTIYKDHKVGQKLVKMLEYRIDAGKTDFNKRCFSCNTATAADVAIKEFLDTQLIKRTPVSKILYSVEQAKDNAFFKGQVAKAEEIRNALYINEKS